MPDKKQILYTALSQDEVYKDKVGTQDEFYAKLNDPAKAKMLYTTLSQDEVYRDKVGSEDQFYEKIGLKKKESTTSKSGDGISQSQDEISKQLQQNIQGRPSDFATPKTDYSQKTLDQNIRLAGRQFAAQKQIDNSKQIVKKAKAHAEAANMRASMKFVEIDDAKQAGDENKVNTLIPEYNKELDVIKQSDLDIREAADNYNKAVNENNKINNYFIKQAKLIDTKAKYQEQEEGGNAIINDLGEGTKVLWNSIVPNTISGIGIVTESAGALLDEFRGDPTQYNTLGDYIMQVGQTIHKGGKDLNMSISDDWQKSVFDKEGITDPKAWLNTMISGTGNIISMAALSEIGVPPTVTATVQGADIVYDAAEQAGLSEKERLMMSMTLAPIMGKLDDIGANPYLKEFTAKIFSKGLKETAEKIAAKNITPKMAMEAFGASLSENAGRYIKEVGKDVFKESLTEGAEQAVQITGESIFNIIKGDNAKEGAGKYANRDINAPGYWENTLTEITKSTVEGGIGSLIPVAISAHGISPAKIRLYKDLQDPNPEATKGWYDMLDVALQNEDITPEQHDLFVKQLDFAVRLNKKIPDKIDNPEARAQASDFIQQSEDKKVEIENADEAFKPLLEEEDNQIKADLKKIFETNEPIKTEENDKTYGTRISSEERIGEKPIEAESKQSTSPEEIKAGGNDEKNKKLNNLFNLPLSEVTADSTSRVSSNFFNDLLKGDTPTPKLYSELNVPSRLNVFSNVLRATKNDEVFRGIIPFIPVDVMNVLVGKDFSSKDPLGYKSMFVKSLTSNNSPYIVSSIIDAIKKSSTVSGTEGIDSPLVGRWSEIFNRALTTDELIIPEIPSVFLHGDKDNKKPTTEQNLVQEKIKKAQPAPNQAAAIGEVEKVETPSLKEEPVKLTAKQQKNDRLAMDMQEFNKLTEHKKQTKAGKLLEQKIRQQATDLGYSVSFGNRRKLIILNEKGKQVRKTPVKQEVKEQSQEAIDFAKKQIEKGVLNWDNNMFTPRVDLDMSWSDIRKGKKDIEAGKFNTSPAKKLIEELHAHKELGYFNYIEGAGGKIKQHQVPITEEAIAPEQGNKLTKDEETDALKNQVELAKQYDEYVSSLTEDELIEHYKNIEDETESNDRAESAIDGENKQEPEQPIQRLSREEEKGRDRAGEINAESTILTERVHRAVAQELGINPSDLSKGQIIKEEEKYLEEYAKAKGVWIDDLYEYFGRVPDDYGQENKVYYTEDGKYAVKTNMGVFNESWLDFLDRMALHNYLFPESAYTLEGFGKDNMGNFNAILKQPFIHGTAPTDSEIESFMKENGFERITEDGDKSNDYISQEQGLIVYDLHRGNVIKTDSGKLIVFDPVVALNTEDKGFDGNRKIGGEQTTEPTTQVELSIEEQGNKLEEIFNLERTRDSKKSESVKEDFQKEIDKIAETMPKNLVEKAKFVKLNLNQIRKEMESKNLLKVEC